MGKKLVIGVIVVLAIVFFGYQFWNNTSSSGVTNISTDELKDKLTNSDTVFIDVREPYEYEEGHIKEFINLPLGEISEESLEGFSKEAEILIICRSGNRSMQAAEKLLELGFKKPVNVEGGMLAWDGQVVR